jgi:5-methylcytosine-specific restriction endonuclease McrA
MTRERLPQVCGLCGETYTERDCPCSPIAADREFYATTYWIGVSKSYLRIRPYCEAPEHAPGCSGRASTVDHIRPRSEGGSDGFRNLQSL